MIDFTFPSQKTIPAHHIIRKIYQQEDILRDLTAHYQSLLNIEKKKIEKWKNESINAIHDRLQGEEDIVLKHEEEPVHLEYDIKMETICCMENTFHQAMFLLTYSYFESIVAAMCKEASLKVENNVETNVTCILKNTNSGFPTKIKDIYDYVAGDLKKIRNLFTHNYNGTSKNGQLEAAHRECERNIGLHEIATDVFVIDENYAANALTCENKVLMALASILKL